MHDGTERAGDLAGRTALVTGGATGIGESIADLFAREGAAVVVADVDEVGGESTVAAIEDAGGTAAFVPTDITDESQVESLVETTVERFGGPDVLVNNAGGSLDDDNPHRVDRATFENVVELNLTGTFLCTRAVLPAMVEAGGGAMVHLSSINATAGIGLAAYSAAKSGIVAFSRVVATQYGRHGVRSNALCPGTVITDASSPTLTERGPVREQWLDQYPLGRFGRSKDVAEAALFLATDRAAFVTGTELVVDGGFTAGPDQTLEREMYDIGTVPR